MGIEVKNSEWTLQAAAFLKPACDDHYTIADVEQDVKSKAVSLFNIYDNGKHSASMVLRLDKNPQGKELVVVCVGGKIRSGDLIMSLSNFWDNLAQLNEAKTIRAHVSKAGMAKLMERVGGVLSEYVYRKEVNYGR